MIVAGVAGILILAAKPVWSGLQKVRARKLVAEGEAFLAQNRGSDALRAGQAALRAGAADARAHQLLLKVLGGAGSQDAVYFWTKLANDPLATVQHRRELLRWAMAWGRLDMAEAQWSLLQEERPLPLETIRLGAALYELRGEANQAVNFAQAALQKNPGDIETRVRLGRILLEKGGVRDRTIGKDLLLEQTLRGDVWGIYALRALADADVLGGFEATECIGRVRGHSMRERRDILTEAALQWRITEYKRREIVAAAATEFLKEKGSRLELARWLTKFRNNEELLRFVPEEEALKSRELLLLHVDAMGALGRWEEVEKILGRETAVLDPVFRVMYLARVAGQMNQDRIASLRWTQALDLAGKEGRELLKVADYGRRSGAFSVATEAAERLTRIKGTEGRAGYRELLRIHSADLSRVKDLLERYLADYPEDQQARSDLAYARLLLGENPGELAELLERLAVEKPEYMAYRTTLALARLQGGKHREANEAFGINPGQWRELLPYQQVVFAAALAASGEKAVASEIYKGVDKTQVRVEERRLVEKWL